MNVRIRVGDREDITEKWLEREGKRARGRCEGFCRFIKIGPRDGAPNGDKEREMSIELITRAVLASMGTENEGAEETRKVQAVRGLDALLVADGYVGVCCKSFKKFCINTKRKLLRKVRDQDPAYYRGRVQPRVGQYPHNREAVSGMRDQRFDPSAEQMRGWIDICMQSLGSLRGVAGVVCLPPLLVRTADKLDEALSRYLEDGYAHAKKLREQKGQEVARQVNQLVIPLRLSDGWYLSIVNKLMGSETPVTIVRAEPDDQANERRKKGLASASKMLGKVTRILSEEIFKAWVRWADEGEELLEIRPNQH